MKSRNRNAWIIGAVILMAVCFCATATGVAAVGWLADRFSNRGGATSFERERIEKTFEVGDSPSLEVVSFAGYVTVRAGESSVIRVVATKRASSAGDLSRMKVEVTQQGDGLEIETERPRFPMRNASVDLEITVPASTRLDLEVDAGIVDVSGLTGRVEVNTRAGNVAIREVSGEIDASSGSGIIDVREAVGPVRLTNGAGVVMYQGTPKGDCRFESLLGAITLALPADPNVAVALDVAMGEIDVDCAVDGRVTKREVKGVIGSGDEGRIEAVSGVGGVGLVCR